MAVDNCKLSIIIPVYNDLQGLSTTFSSLANCHYDNKLIEIIVVNNGADLLIDSFCKRVGVKCINLSPNRGSYVARNYGINSAEGCYLAFLDANIKVHHNWLQKGLELIRKYDYVAGNVLIDKSEVKDILNFHDYLTAFPIGLYLSELHFGHTANLLVKREVFLKLGIFDGDLPSGGDLEFGDRVFRSGEYSQAFSPDCIVYHPSRNHKEKLQKAIRVDEGQQMLDRTSAILWMRDLLLKIG